MNSLLTTALDVITSDGDAKESGGDPLDIIFRGPAFNKMYEIRSYEDLFNEEE